MSLWFCVYNEIMSSLLPPAPARPATLNSQQEPALLRGRLLERGLDESL